MGLNKADLIRQFPPVFAEKVGQLEGEYHIKLDATLSPVQHAPRRVPVALRDQLKAELDKMTEQGIIAPVTAPTPWDSSLVAVPKKNRVGKGDTIEEANSDHDKNPVAFLKASMATLPR